MKDIFLVVLEGAAAALLAAYLFSLRPSLPPEPPSARAFLEASASYNIDAACQYLSPQSELTCDGLRQGAEMAQEMGIITDDIRYLGSIHTSGGTLAAYYLRAHSGGRSAEIGLLVYLDRDGKVVKEE